MEILLVFLSTAIGTVAGVVVATLMMQRKFRVAGAGTDIALKTQLQNTEWALAAAGRDVEELRKQLELRDQAVQPLREELEKAQQQLISALTTSEKEAGARAQAEQRLQDLQTQASELKRSTEESAGQQILALQAEVAGSRRQVEELTAQLAAHTDQSRSVEEDSARQVLALETEIAGSRRHIEELTAQIAALGEARRSSEEESGQQVSALEIEVAGSRRHIEELTAQIASLDEARQSTEEESGRQISALETEIVTARREIENLTAELAGQHRINDEAEALLAAERTSVRDLADRLESLTNERESLEIQLQKERRSAAEGMQLLQLVQSKLGGAPVNGGNGNGAPQLVETV
jgi:chromosome segregation ATPase